MMKRYLFLILVLCAGLHAQSTDPDTTNTYAARIDTPEERAAWIANLMLGNSATQNAADLPISTATQTALDGKLSLSGGTMTGDIEMDSNSIFNAGTITFESASGGYFGDFGVNPDGSLEMNAESYFNDTAYFGTFGSGQSYFGQNGELVLDNFLDLNGNSIMNVGSIGSAISLSSFELYDASTGTSQNWNLRQLYDDASSLVMDYSGIPSFPVGATFDNITVDTNTLFVDSLGNAVGIGTATPTALLDVQGSAIIAGVTYFGADSITFIDSDGNLNIGAPSIAQLPGGLDMAGGNISNANSAFIGGVDISADSINVPIDTLTGSLTVYDGSNLAGNLTVDTNSLFVDSVNNWVGIGTTSPSESLEVVGNVKSSGPLKSGAGAYSAEFGGDYLAFFNPNGVQAIVSTYPAGSFDTYLPEATGTIALIENNADVFSSGAATDGYVLTADGVGGAAWEAVAGGGGGTNLSVTNVTATTLDVASDSGTDATIPAAVATTSAGLLSGADKAKLDAITGTNTGDQTTIAGITGTTAQFNTALTDNDFATLAGSEALSNKTLNNPTITNFTESVVAIGNTGTSQIISLANGTVQTATLNGNCTFTMPTATAGKSFTLLLKSGAGSFTATFTDVKWPNNTAPTITATASRLDVVSFISDGTNWYGSITQNFTH